MSNISSHSTDHFHADVIVIGGGPAGSTISALLKDKGHRVILLEKEQHPRFHIGESLLPLSLAIFERLGVHEAIKEIGVFKPAAEFHGTMNPDKTIHKNINKDSTQTFYFKKAFNKQYSHAYQVRRSEFDHILLNNAKNKGVEVFENTRVTNVNFHDRYNIEVIAKSKDRKTQNYRTRFLIDASGRDTFLSRKLGLKSKNPKHASAAIFAHFENIPRHSGEDGGNIRIHWFRYGWIWMIPLKNNITSVGAVCHPEYLKTRKSSLDDFFMDTLRLSDVTWERLATAQKITPTQATGNYTYSSKTTHGEDFILIGDAFAFLDPVFSSGVHLAMTSATMATDVVHTCLQTPEKAEQAFKQYDRKMQSALKRFSWLIYRFNTPVMYKLFMQPGNVFQLENAIISLLAGDVFEGSLKLESRFFAFKVVYYLHAILYAKGMWKSYWQRKRNPRIELAEDPKLHD